MPLLVGLRLVRKLVPTRRVCWCGFQGYRARPPLRPQASPVLRSDGDPPAHGLCREAARGPWEPDAAGSRAGLLPRGLGLALTSGTPAPAVAAGTAPRSPRSRQRKGLILRAGCGLGGASALTRGHLPVHLPVHLSHLFPRSDTARQPFCAERLAGHGGQARQGQLFLPSVDPRLVPPQSSGPRHSTRSEGPSRTGPGVLSTRPVCGTSGRPRSAPALLLHVPEGPCTHVCSDRAPGRTTVPEPVVSFSNTKGYCGSKDSLGWGEPRHWLHRGHALTAAAPPCGSHAPSPGPAMKSCSSPHPVGSSGGLLW